MQIEIHDMRPKGDGSLGYRFVGVVELATCPRVGETVHMTGNDDGFTVRHVLHVVGAPYPQVRGW